MDSGKGDRTQEVQKADFAEKIKKAMEACGMGQRELARACGLPISTIHTIVSGQVRPKLHDAAVIAQSLLIPLDYFAYPAIPVSAIGDVRTASPAPPALGPEWESVIKVLKRLTPDEALNRLIR